MEEAIGSHTWEKQRGEAEIQKQKKTYNQLPNNELFPE